MNTLVSQLTINDLMQIIGIILGYIVVFGSIAYISCNLILELILSFFDIASQRRKNDTVEESLERIADALIEIKN